MPSLQEMIAADDAALTSGEAFIEPPAPPPPRWQDLPFVYEKPPAPFDSRIVYEKTPRDIAWLFGPDGDLPDAFLDTGPTDAR